MGVLLDRKTRRRVRFGQSLIRKDYKGFPHRYELQEFNEKTMRIRVKKLMHDDSWRVLEMPISSLQLDWVMDDVFEKTDP
jgi:hypothetical protein